ncbi:glycerol kinase GlpK [Desulfosudis oleivorans]|uniref:Glycerol kinase n=1 Tax=Desulfosudis oleivorans (strain DSM 6200 / JCM 39069 / Hxd3) TaxID=96561 RepID=A8ZYU4_DESOH|nr:glycerol kinase GlpK [Desulfosudis oleivorans]ABW67199.1 glycerol kinase [Desulfosudis oleivorans Hxd3]
MTDKQYVGAIDQGTTSTRFVVFDTTGAMVASHQVEHRQIYPEPGFVEHDPMEIRANTAGIIAEALKKGLIEPDQIAAVGITNQRETTVVWNRHTGRPLYNAIVWQDTRTADMCTALKQEGHEPLFKEKTGLPAASYFSGPKIRWILDNVEGARAAAEKGDALFGNMDTWLIWWLTGGPGKGVHVTDVTNASRTMLMNLETLAWDSELLKILDIPEKMLPRIMASSEVYGHAAQNWGLAPGTPVSGDLGDQQAALFGQVCFEPGEAKNTYGTGCFLLSNTGQKIIHSNHGLLTTLGYKIGNEPPVYALEGSVAVAGSLVQWLRDNLNLIRTSPEVEDLAKTVADNGGVYFVPAFSGLFAPHWDSSARGLIIGMTHYINKGHIARAALESTAFQVNEIFSAMEKDSGIPFKSLKVDGGMAANDLLMQFQADLVRVPVIRSAVLESTVLGAAYAAGLAVGFWSKKEDLRRHWKENGQWQPEMAAALRDKMCAQWDKAIKRAAGWKEEG